MATNIETSDSSEEEMSNSSSQENTPIREAEQLRANLSKHENASIARKRKISRNTVGWKRCVGGKKDPHVRVHGRVQEYKNEYLTVTGKKLRCDACKETISKKKSTVSEHIIAKKNAQVKQAI